MTFGVHKRDRAAAEAALADHSADIAIVFEPVRFSEFQTLVTVRQTVHAVMGADHPLAAKSVIRISDCVDYPVGLPSAQYGVRHLLDAAMLRGTVRLTPTIESDSFEFLRNYPRTEKHRLVPNSCRSAIGSDA